MPSITNNNGQLIRPVIFSDYDKLSDDVYEVGRNVILRFNVSLAKRNQNKERILFHKEFSYTSKETGERLITIRRSFDYFLTLENVIKPDNCSKAYIRIGPQEFFLVTMQMDEVFKWFTDDKHKNLFVNANDKLRIAGAAPSVTIPRLPMAKYIRFEATIIERYGYQEPGVTIYLSDEKNRIDISLDTFMGLYYSIKNFNMYQCAQNMLNYTGRPEYGTNMCTFEPSGRTYTHDDEVPKDNTIVGRRIKSKALEDKLEG